MKWEYKTLDLEAGGFFGGKVDERQLEARMNDIGAEEWELVSVMTTAQGSGSTRSVIAIFKRPQVTEGQW